MASSSSSLVLPTLYPKTLILPKVSSLSLPSFKSPKPTSFCFSHSLSFKPPSSAFLRRFAVSSEYEQQEDEREVDFPPEPKLFVGNLPYSISSAQLAALFVEAGNVEKVEVIYDKQTGRSRGFGFVTMSTIEEVEAAAQQFNGYELDGRPLTVNSGPPPTRRDGFRSGGTSGAAGFRRGASSSVTGFRRGGRSGVAGFQRWGRSDVAGFRRGGRSGVAGFRRGGHSDVAGFRRGSSSGVAGFQRGGHSGISGFRRGASSGVGGFRSGGRSGASGFRRGDTSGVGGFQSGGTSGVANQLHVGNLAWGVDDFALESLFNGLGNVVEAKVMYHRDSGRSRGFGFVTYSTAEEVEAAISSLDGADLKGRPIQVSEAKPRHQF